MSKELTPITRKETFLAKAGGQNVVTPTPITREETFLQAIIDNGSGGGGGTGGGVLVCNVDNEDALDKTWQEIHDAAFAIVQVETPVGILKCPVTLVASSGDEYIILSAMITDGNGGEADVSVDKYIASSANDYPVLQ